jgi:hypothetical protein
MRKRVASVCAAVAMAEVDQSAKNPWLTAFAAGGGKPLVGDGHDASAVGEPLKKSWNVPV